MITTARLSIVHGSVLLRISSMTICRVHRFSEHIAEAGTIMQCLQISFKASFEASTAAVSTLMKTDFCTGIPVVVSNPIESEITSAVKIRLENINKTYVRILIIRKRS